METIYYSDDKKYAYFNGVKYSMTKQGYYRATVKSNASNANLGRLHRAVWFYHNGEIPNGHDVHHKDENKLNNHIKNLEVVEHGKHALNHIDISLGKTWHGKPIKTYSCVNCGKLFQTNHYYGKEQNVYCSISCGDKYRWEQKHPKESTICLYCKKQFIPSRTNQEYCNNICAQTIRTRRYRAKKKLENPEWTQRMDRRIKD